ncbi:MAG: hypothetical protein PUC58_02810 [Oscillospiraceae bacterium]|nr:hypothetical protein [Oscillospiraceae bacterium]
MTEQIFVQARQSPQAILACIVKGFNAAWAEICPSNLTKSLQKRGGSLYEAAVG